MTIDRGKTVLLSAWGRSRRMNSSRQSSISFHTVEYRINPLINAVLRTSPQSIPYFSWTFQFRQSPNPLGTYNSSGIVGQADISAERCRLGGAQHSNAKSTALKSESRVSIPVLGGSRGYPQSGRYTLYVTEYGIAYINGRTSLAPLSFISIAHARFQAMVD
jgi:hypothetical protein